MGVSQNWGVPTIRTIVFGGLHWGPTILGNYQINFKIYMQVLVSWPFDLPFDFPFLSPRPHINGLGYWVYGVIQPYTYPIHGPIHVISSNGP